MSLKWKIFRFSIILQTDTDNSVDCIQGLHISFEFDENRVIRHFYSNEECKEEIHEGMPLSRGFPFFIQIDVGNDQDEYVYIVLINGKRFYKFFEIPTGLMKKIRYIKICGDVNISRVH